MYRCVHCGRIADNLEGWRICNNDDCYNTSMENGNIQLSENFKAVENMSRFFESLDKGTPL
jgi:hypothetical protein